MHYLEYFCTEAMNQAHFGAFPPWRFLAAVWLLAVWRRAGGLPARAHPGDIQTAYRLFLALRGHVVLFLPVPVSGLREQNSRPITATSCPCRWPWV